MYAISRYETYIFNNTGRDAKRAKDEQGKIKNLAEMIKVIFNVMKRSFVNYGHSMYKRHEEGIQFLVISQLYVQVIYFLIDI